MSSSGSPARALGHSPTNLVIKPEFWCEMSWGFPGLDIEIICISRQKCRIVKCVGVKSLFLFSLQDVKAELSNVLLFCVQLRRLVFGPFVKGHSPGTLSNCLPAIENTVEPSKGASKFDSAFV